MNKRVLNLCELYGIMDKQNCKILHVVTARDFFSTLGIAVQRPEAKPSTNFERKYGGDSPKFVYTERTCMRCAKPFQSEGIHNRLCGCCSSKRD